MSRTVPCPKCGRPVPVPLWTLIPRRFGSGPRYRCPSCSQICKLKALTDAASVVGVLLGGSSAIYILGPLRNGRPELPTLAALAIIGMLMLGGAIGAGACVLGLDVEPDPGNWEDSV